MSVTRCDQVSRNMLLLNQTETGQLLPRQSFCIVGYMYCSASWLLLLVLSFFGQVQVQEVREAFINKETSNAMFM